ncbi:uncharacterized protein BX664DRAFT_343918 [Halteromyces radiatus]|uniref:uncharacterized protein n=1 Tax=Halteromyces radiatus TaxID=101107 RepID=UPI002220CCDA|nr:uncharacterized protein BX664DRAFT_343918 [Halteromyces radiatus]KAI8076786.1 hypothetical protein BX664DRAFT_343918 [Halteromyces radiatus]
MLSPIINHLTSSNVQNMLHHDPYKSNQQYNLDPIEWEESMVSKLSISPIVPLIDLYFHFQDLPSFVKHPDFDHFAYCWMEYQYNLVVSKDFVCRPKVICWLESMSTQLVSIVTRYPTDYPQEEEDPEASTRHIKAAYQRLIHHIKVLHKLLHLFEQGRIIGQSPQEVALPFYNQILEFKLNQQCPISAPSLEQYVTSSNVMPLTTTSSFRSLSCLEMIPYLNDSCASSPHVHPLSLVLPSPHQQQQQPQYHDHYGLLPWSTPVTPIGTTMTSPTTFWSCPVSPSYHRNNHCIQSNSSPSIKYEEEPITPMELEVPVYPKLEDYQISSNISTSSSNITNKKYHDDEDDDDDDSEYQYSQDDDDEEEEEKENMDKCRAQKESKFAFVDPKKKKQRRPNRKTSRQTKRTIAKQTISGGGRTATSYDEETTHYLKTLFFSIYSRQDKLTKEQRRQVVEHTGLKPRNITYWFSNHKRRFHSALQLFKKLLVESDGRIQTYDDFLIWRRENGLSEDMADNDLINNNNNNKKSI